MSTNISLAVHNKRNRLRMTYTHDIIHGVHISSMTKTNALAGSQTTIARLWFLQVKKFNSSNKIHTRWACMQLDWLRENNTCSAFKPFKSTMLLSRKEWCRRAQYHHQSSPQKWWKGFTAIQQFITPYNWANCIDSVFGSWSSTSKLPLWSHHGQCRWLCQTAPDDHQPLVHWEC